MPDLIDPGDYRALVKRKISEQTCELFRYSVSSVNNKTVQIAPYRDQDGRICAQHIRFPNKEFIWQGDSKKVQLFGQHLWRDKGKKLVITEGEIDAMSVSQLQGNKWPVVSIPSGAQSAKKAIRNNIEWVEGFDQVIFMFDNDEPGEEAAKECAEILSPGKAFIASLPLKDANDMLVEGRGREVLDAVFGAKEFRPDGLLSVDDILEDIAKKIEWGLPWFLPSLTDATYGRRYGELYGFGAGTGVGKTDLFTQQIAYDVEVLNLKVGLVFLEQKPSETGKRLAGKMAGKRFHIPDAGWTEEELQTTVQGLRGKVMFYDSWGETAWEVVSSKIRYMAVALGIRVFYLDHLTAMADTSNEKESLEQIMKEMAGLANELNIMVHYISHLTTPEGKPHEEGGRVMIRHFKGSRAIGFWSFFMFGLERDQQAEDEAIRETTTFRILKDRYTGQGTGAVIYLGYNKETGRLFETEKPKQNDAKDFGFKEDPEDEF